MAETPPPPHVLAFPFPAVGHVTSMLRLAQLLSLSGVTVTFLNTDHVHTHMFGAAAASYPENFHFRTISDGLPVDHHGSNFGGLEVYESMRVRTRPLFREMVVGSTKKKKSTNGGGGGGPPVDCIVADGVMGFVLDVALELGIPIFQFHTHSPCSVWAFFNFPEVVKAGELSITESEEDMDRPITKVPGMESVLRCRDFPIFDRSVSHEDDPSLHALSRETNRISQSRAIVLNTFEDLDAPLLSVIRNTTTCCPKIYTLGPLHEHLKSRIKDQGKQIGSYISQVSPNGLWKMDKSCLSWLDDQPLHSVVYVSFGSTTTMTKSQLMEFWYGLVNSRHRFLWARRPDSCKDGKILEEEIPNELVEGTKERGMIVEWAPQEEVLANKAVGGFLTHSGWNSTMEGVATGVPMICWPYFADQLIISRFVGEVWRLGLDMKDSCDRVVVEEMVRCLMVERRDEFFMSAARMAKLARASVSEGGSSYCNLDHLVDDIRSLANRSS